MYTITTYKKKDIVQLKNIWNMLEKGVEMTYFQSYHWNYMLSNFIPEGKNYEAVYFLVKDENEKAVLIAPLWIIKSTFRFVNKKGSYFIGRNGWSDYLNLIYSTFDSGAFYFLLYHIQHKYGCSYFYFEQLKEESGVFQHIQHYCNIIKDYITTCVYLHLPDTVDDYQKILSKNSKQNIRTARNRLEKDGRHISFCFDSRPDLDICKKMRETRVGQKRLKEQEGESWGVRIKRWINKFLTVSFPVYLPFYEDHQSRFLTAYIDGELSAFFNYGYDAIRQEIIVMAVGTNEKFAKYSPGILLLYEFILYQIKNSNIKIIDFTRGDERYKYALGGVNHIIHSIAFKI